MTTPAAGSEPPPPVPDRIARNLSPARAALISHEDSRRVVGLLEDGTSIVITEEAMLVVDDEQVLRRFTWSSVDFASFESDSRTLSVRLVDGTQGLEARLAGNVTDVATAIKERVDSSIVHLEKSVLSDGTPVRVALRRGADGELFTQVTSVGTPRLTEADQRRIDDIERRVRQTVGLDE